MRTGDRGESRGTGSVATAGPRPLRSPARPLTRRALAQFPGLAFLRGQLVDTGLQHRHIVGGRLVGGVVAGGYAVLLHRLLQTAGLKVFAGLVRMHAARLDLRVLERDLVLDVARRGIEGLGEPRHRHVPVTAFGELLPAAMGAVRPAPKRQRSQRQGAYEERGSAMEQVSWAIQFGPSAFYSILNSTGAEVAGYGPIPVPRFPRTPFRSGPRETRSPAPALPGRPGRPPRL